MKTSYLRDATDTKEPEAYARGWQDFYGRKFLVTPDVLIPRPETEMLIDEVLKLMGKPILPGVKATLSSFSRPDVKILDVGTGSGCIAVTLALELPEAKVTAVDISRAALMVAQENAERLGASRVEFHQSDLLQDIDDDFDIIVANLPYVDRDWEWLDHEALDFEPELALYAENEGLELIFKLIDSANNRCRYLVLEADPSQHDRIIEYATRRHFAVVSQNGFALVIENRV